ncbi:MAG: DNA topoisomerase 4 subunit A [Anaerostipes sp.]|uniref:DNA gyrase/topoisomerase IV subunit A n=1 Tax=Anaerostipes sp. 992a TaxID=1261637 RepID=UPI0009533710|nr:DNA topoisomerase (ATP-hydrolyzing) [Anaerostipes sp. 992a]MCI5951071.1 DNA topoisomerase 4 subunit A [Anaerostipes sp.]OLR61980.1 DNA topoisomerase [Anaerostipes sp. 992a]
MSEQIMKAEYSEVMQKSYIDYAMSVICARALPDVRDGLKPVQRRVLYAMDELGLNYDKPHRKSARIVGDTMGKYHPHGDSSIYDALVVLEQDFKKGMALVDGHGNFGSIEGDGAAAMRYTEAKLKKFTQEVYLSDLDKNVVDFVPNFDETEKEPEVLPVRIPNILVNGAEGIAVGMTTNIPPHNLGEVIDAVKYYMDHPRATTEELMQFIQGPDFPTGGLVINKKELVDIYTSGTGKIKLRGKVEFEKGSKGTRDKLVISEIPYTMIGANIGKFLSDVVGLLENKLTTDIVDISNESSKEGIRIVLELKKNTDVERLKNLLYKKTKLEDTFGVNMLAVVDGRPETLSLRRIIEEHTKFHYEINTRKYTTLLQKLYDQKEIKEGLIQACDMIDLIIEILRGSKNLRDVKQCLTHGITDKISFKSQTSKKQASELHFTEKQASAILDLKLYRLIGLEILALKKEYEEICKKIEEYEDLLNNPRSMTRRIKKDLDKIKKSYALERKTVVDDVKEAVFVKAPIKEQQLYFVMDRFGYAKTLDANTYHRNQEAVQKDYRYVISCLNTDKLCFFTDMGIMHQLKVLDIPAGRLRDKGTPLDNLCKYDSSQETVLTFLPAQKFNNTRLLFVTTQSMTKIVDGSEFLVTKKTVSATKLSEQDRLLCVKPIDQEVEDQTIVFETEQGIFLKFLLSEIPTKKKAAIGVRGMKLQGDDQIKRIYLPEEEAIPSIDYKGKTLEFHRLKLASRDGKGSKVRR